MAQGYDTDEMEADFASFVDLSVGLDQYSHGDYRRAKAGCSCARCHAAMRAYKRPPGTPGRRRGRRDPETQRFLPT